MIRGLASEEPSERLDFRIASLPGVDFPNPYVRLFYAALGHYAIHAISNVSVDPQWLEGHRDSIDAVHFHWPEFVWRSHQLAIVRSLERYRVKGAWRLRRALPGARQMLGVRSLRRFVE